MRELTLQIEDSKYNQFVQFLTTIDYIKILTQLEQTNAADTEKKVSAKVASAKQKISELRKNIVSPQDEQDILKQIKDSKDEWERNI